MNKYSPFLFIITLVFLIISCNNKPQIVNNYKGPKILAHRGTGREIQLINNDTIFENTFAAAKYGFANFDGIEADIQMSKSGTIWLFHNDELFSTDSLNIRCIPGSTDDEILEFNKQLPKWRRLCTLEQVMTYQSTEVKNKYISLDVKGYFKNSCIKGRNISNKYMQDIAKEIIRLAKEYNIEKYTLVETDYKEVLNTVKRESSNIECYLLGYNNFYGKMEQAIENNYDGLSFNMEDTSLNFNNIKKLQKKNLKIQIWTVNINKKKQKALKLEADFIQSDVVF